MAIIDGRIKCNRCNELKPLSEFAPSVVAQKSGTCRPCRRDYRAGRPEREREYQKNFYAKNPGYSRANKLAKWHGLTVEQYDAMLAAQGGVCACCGASANRSGRALFVDHDHSTGAIRGIICHGCNAGIGSLGDTLDGLRQAIRYLELAARNPSPLFVNDTVRRRGTRGG